jgi:multidrug efflux pump subunit AcrB
LLRVILNKKKTVVLVTLGIMVVSIYLATFLNFELMPATDDGVIQIAVETRPGLLLEKVDDILIEIEEIVASHPDVEQFTLTSAAGGGGGVGLLLGGGGGGSVITAYLYSDRQMQTSEVIEQLRHETAHILETDIDISAAAMAMGPPADTNIEIVLEGDSLESIRESSEMVEALMLSHPDIIRVNSTMERANPQGEIEIDPLRAAAQNITPQMVTGAIFTALNGVDAAEITINEQRYNVWVKYPAGRYQTVSDITNMMIMSATGTLVPLSDISTLVFTDTPQTISRQNGFYTATITGVPIEAARFTAQSQIVQGVNELAFPGGVELSRGFVEEMQAQELFGLLFTIITAIFLVFMVLAIQFESIRHSLMVMTCIPLAIIGSFLMMFITGTTISMVSLLGFLVLIGLVVNNGILFVDTANRYREEMELQEALILAGSTRLRPILMITLTSILAMLPLAMGVGASGAIMMQGLGITVIGGLTASTLLALLLLPTFYLILDGNPEKRAARKIRKAEKQNRKIAPPK